MIHADDIFKKIGFILNDLQDQQEYLAHHPEKINVPEMELFLANANFLAEHVKVFVKLKSKELLETEPDVNLAPVEQVKEPTVEEVEENESRVDIEPAENVSEAFSFDFSETGEESFEFEKRPVEELYNRALTEEEIELLATKKQNGEPDNNIDSKEEDGPEPFLIPATADITTPANDPKVETSQPENTETTANQTADRKPTINELLAAGSRPNLHHATRKAAITDLKQAINLNDKLLFIKNLFNGYNLAYAEAIEIINKLPDFQAADSFLKKNYAVKNNWAEKQATTDRFYEILNLRFPPQD